MSKTCAICGDKFGFAGDYNLSKDHKKIKICFTCYEYVATAIKGSKKAVEILKSRYKDDIDDKIVKYIDSLDTDIRPKENGDSPDGFMELMNNNLSETKPEKVEVKPTINNVIRLDKLSEARKDRLIRIKIVSTILLFVFLVFGLLFSFYILTQGYGEMLAAVTAIVSVGFAVVFGFIKNIISVIINE